MVNEIVKTLPIKLSNDTWVSYLELMDIVCVMEDKVKEYINDPEIITLNGKIGLVYVEIMIYGEILGMVKFTLDGSSTETRFTQKEEFVNIKSYIDNEEIDEIN